MDWKKDIQIEELDTPYFEIAEKFGLEIAIEMEKMFRGRQVYFPFLEHICRERNKEKIVQEYNGYNVTELALKYGYSERHIRRLCADKIEKETFSPLDGQLDMFE